MAFGDKVIDVAVPYYGLGLSVSNILCPDYGNSDFLVKVLDRAGSYQGAFGGYGTGDGLFSGSSPWGAACVNTDWYVTGPNRVQKFNSNFAYQSQFGTVGTGNNNFSGARYIASDGTDLFINDYWNNRIKKHALDGTYITSVAVTTPGQLHVANGKIYVRAGRYIKIYDLSLSYESQIDLGYDSANEKFAVNSSNIFIGRSRYDDNIIDVLDLAGNLIDSFFYNGGTQPAWRGMVADESLLITTSNVGFLSGFDIVHLSPPAAPTNLTAVKVRREV